MNKTMLKEFRLHNPSSHKYIDTQDARIYVQASDCYLTSLLLGSIGVHRKRSITRWAQFRLYAVDLRTT